MPQTITQDLNFFLVTSAWHQTIKKNPLMIHWDFPHGGGQLWRSSLCITSTYFIGGLWTPEQNPDSNFKLPWHTKTDFWIRGNRKVNHFSDPSVQLESFHVLHHQYYSSFYCKQMKDVCLNFQYHFCKSLTQELFFYSRAYVS